MILILKPHAPFSAQLNDATIDITYIVISIIAVPHSDEKNKS